MASLLEYPNTALLDESSIHAVFSPVVYARTSPDGPPYEVDVNDVIDLVKQEEGDPLKVIASLLCGRAVSVGGAQIRLVVMSRFK